MKHRESRRKDGRNRIRKRAAMGFGMLLWGLCLVPAGAESETQESTEEIIEEMILTEQTEWEESLPVSEPTEEILIENQASMDETLEEGTDHEGAEWIGHESLKSDGERIQEAIDSEAEVTITLSQNIALSETIRIPSGKTVALVPEENMEITIFREDGCSGSMFYVEKDGLLILGREGGRLRIHQGEKNQTEHPIAEGEGKLLTEGEVVVFPEPEEAPAADALTSDSLMEEEFIDDGTMPVSMDLKDAVIEWMSNTEEVYNGAPHTPEILVWAGPILLMKGFDYDVTYDNHVHAGTAEVTITATGFGSCTGSRKTTFTIRQAVPEYQVENQKAESGVLLSDLKVPASAAGVNQEKVTGTLYWSDSEGGMALPPDMTLSGMEGETLTLFWTFYPEESFSDYMPVSGNATITFLAAKIPDNGMAGEWDGISDGVGNLSNGSSSVGTMEETEKITEKTTEAPTEKTTEKTKETPGTEKETAAASGTATAGGISAGNGASTGGGSAVSTGGTGSAVASSGSSGISVTSGVSGKTSNPRTGDAAETEVWMLWCFLAAGAAIVVLGYQWRKAGAGTRL